MLTDTQITQTYTFPASKLDIVLYATDIAGAFNGSYDATHHRHWLQLCKRSSSFLNAAFVFGTNFNQQCSVDVNELYDHTLHPPLYFEPFVRFEEGGQVHHVRMPVFIANNPQAVTRFFMVENVLGDQGDGVHNIMYATSVKIVVRLRDGEGMGKIYTPSIRLQYDSVGEMQRNTTVPVSFQMRYEMDPTASERTVWIWVGVLAGLAVAFAALETWAEMRRGGSEHLCCFYFIFILTKHLSSAISLVLIASSLWTLVYYKNQREVVFLVQSGLQTPQFIVLLLGAFIFRLIDVLRLVFLQVTADIFLVDWESASKVDVNERASTNHPSSSRQLPHLEGIRGPSNLSSGHQVSPSVPQSSFPSVWRMYLVANEWNEIQSHRRVNGLIQLISCIVLLDVVGLGNISSMDALSTPSTTTFPPYNPSNTHSSPHSSLLRFTWICIVYLSVAGFQALIITPIYERFFEDKIGQLVDLCSTCNVSLLVLTSRLHGHYVHGRSVHARSDVGLRQMHENFAKEEKDLVSKRGLLPGEDQQTFELSISHNLRANINKIVTPVINDTRLQHMQHSQHLDKHIERSIQSHYVINQLLKAFIEHLLEEEEYTVRRKSLLEGLLDFEAGKDTGSTFYYDNGHSFDQSLMYGHEGSWVLFEVLLCSCVDLLCLNFSLALIITFMCMLLLKRARESFGKRNLAIKTMVDKRFLI